MIEVKLEEGDRLDWALKAFKRKMLKSASSRICARSVTT
jgi:ribosomal protein S21